MKIKKGDTVKIITGKDAGKTGKVIKAFPRRNKIIIEGLNLYKKHRRPRREGEQGEIIKIARPIDVSNAMIVCSSCKKTTRVGFKQEGDKKMRVCKKCNAILS